MLTTVEIEIINHMAKTLHVCAYADAVESGELPDAPYASMGADWMDIAPPVSDDARLFAAELAGQIKALNKKSLLFLARDAATADGFDPDDGFEEIPTRRGCSYLEDFGHCLAMQALGHGVSWFDDHEEFLLTVPHVEFYPDFSGLPLMA